MAVKRFSGLKRGLGSGRAKTILNLLLGVQEVPGSNPGSPTKFLKHLQPEDSLNLRSGVHLESRMDASDATQRRFPTVFAFDETNPSRPVFAKTQNSSQFSGALYSCKNPTNPTFGI